MLALGVGLEDAAAGPLARSGSFSGGRDIGVVFNMPGQGGADGAAGLRRRGRAIHAGGGLGAGDPISHATCWVMPAYARSIAVVLGGDASVATNGFWSALTDGHYAAPADAVLHRGQRLRHLRPVEHADAGRQHRGESALVRGSHDPRRRWHRSARGGRLTQRAVRSCAIERAAGAAASDGAASVRPLGTGYAGLQVAGVVALRARARSAGQAASILVPGVFAESEWTRSPLEARARRRGCDRAGACAAASPDPSQRHALCVFGGAPTAPECNAGRPAPDGVCVPGGDCTAHPEGHAHQHADGHPADAGCRVGLQSAHGCVW